MPRYYFHTRDGHVVRDEEGVLLEDAAAARRQGLAVMGEILRYQDESFWRTGEFAVQVVDEDRNSVVTLMVKATP